MNVRPISRAVCSLESLESRRLLATISVTAFGALPNDGADDAYGIQRAINASAPGDTIYFPTGSYKLSTSVATKGQGRIYQGQADAVIFAPSDKHAFNVDGGVTIRNLIFEGRGIRIEKSPWYAENILIDGCTIRNGPRVHPDLSPFGIYAIGAGNTTVRNTKFQNLAFAWMSYGFKNLKLESNIVEDCGYGLKVNFGGYQTGLIIRGNILRRIQRSMAMEIEGGQGAGAGNILIENNAVVDHILGDSHDARNNLHAFGISCVAVVASDVVVRNNYISGPSSRWPTALRMGIEAAGGLAGGNGPIYENNWVEYAGESIGLTTSLNAVIRNNLIRNCKYAPRIQAPANGSAAGATAKWINNGPNVQLPAQGGWTLVGKTPPGVTPTPNPLPNPLPTPNPNPTPIPNPEPTPEPVPTPSPFLTLVAKAVSSSRVDLSWKDTLTGEISYRVERSFDNVKWTQIAILPANSARYSNVNLPASKKVYYRLRALTVKGFTPYSNVAEATTQSLPTAAASSGTKSLGTTGSGGSVVTTLSAVSLFSNGPLIA